MTKKRIQFPSCAQRWVRIFNQDFEVSSPFDCVAQNYHIRLLTRVEKHEKSPDIWSRYSSFTQFCRLLNNSLKSPTSRGQLCRVAVCCKSSPTARWTESNFFSLKLGSLWSKRETVKRFLVSALRRHDTLLLYSINYLLSCYLSIPWASWRVLWYFSKNICVKKRTKWSVCTYL